MTSKPILIAYASQTGATAEVALAICRVLSVAGEIVELHPVEKVPDVGRYRAVVLGTAIRMGHPLPEADTFVRQHRAALAGLPVAVFSLGITVRDGTPESREQARQHLAPLLRHLPEPVSLSLFGGKVDHDRLSPVMRWMASHDKTGGMREGDWRDWAAIRAWAVDLALKLAQPETAPVFA